MPDQQTFVNQDLVLCVSPSYNPSRLDLSKYEPFIDALCETREYQKKAIKDTLRYLLGGRYRDLRNLAEENYQSNEKLRERYGTFREMERHLQLPDQLACSIDLATGTGKSYVMYGIARIMLAEGSVDRVLVLCPSKTIEDGLLLKFRNLSGDITYTDLLPETSAYRSPHIIIGNESIIEGTICVENFHQALAHVHSSIRDSLAGKGEKTLVLNDEIHHVYNRPIGRDSSTQELKKWKEFLVSPEFGFKYLVGFSGTCYIDNDYFSDVVFRYSLQQAFEEGVVKHVDYVREDISQTEYEKFQKIYDNHIENKTTRYRKVKPITIMVTRDISACETLTNDLINFLSEKEEVSREAIEKKVLIVTSAEKHRANIRELKNVDHLDNPIEWIISVSMLTEGWDVQNVFQIVPHEKRAFDSKLLIAQVLGRGLRIPDAYRGERPTVVVFNHDAWSKDICQLVDEVMEVEKRIYCYPITKPEDYNFDLHKIDYNKTQVVEEHEQTGEYEFTKGFVRLVSQTSSLERETTYERASDGYQRVKKTLVRYKMHTIGEVAEAIHNRFASIDLETEGETNYSDRYSIEWLKNLIKESLRRVGETQDQVSDENRQILYRSFNVIHRGVSKVVRHQMTPNIITKINTSSRRMDSVGFGALRRGEVRVFWDEYSRTIGEEDTKQNLQKAIEDWELERSLFEVTNSYVFKTPLNVIISDHEPEYRFVRSLLRNENAKVLNAWIKSTDQDFYPIEFGWRKGEHPKRGFFNPDFFIKKGNHIIVVEIKADSEIDDPSDENRAKFKFAKKHFQTLNSLQEEVVYRFYFLTPRDYDLFFSFIRKGNLEFVSDLDRVLDTDGGSTQETS